MEIAVVGALADTLLPALAHCLPAGWITLLIGFRMGLQMNQLAEPDDWQPNKHGENQPEQF